LKEIVFYDGNCGLCNRVVQFILKHEKRKALCFSAIESPFAKNFFQEHGMYEVDINTFYLYQNGIFYERSQAMIQLSKHLKFPFSLFRLLILIPRFVRDAVYRFIAKRRRKLGGDFCIVKGEDQFERFMN
jgi:predicted DCC family thiol-disulfide oxidoreductase YuxK